jgi:hypothetical protein
MATVKTNYVASSAITITLAALPTSSTLLAGRESALIDNSANGYQDYLLGGQVMTGTSPVAGTIEISVVAMSDDATWPDVFDGTDSAETVSLAEIKNAICTPAKAISTTTASNQAYPFGGVSVAALFGGTCPRKFVVFVTHNTGVNLHATGGNHFLSMTPAYLTMA